MAFAAALVAGALSLPGPAGAAAIDSSARPVLPARRVPRTDASMSERLAELSQRSRRDALDAAADAGLRLAVDATLDSAALPIEVADALAHWDGLGALVLEVEAGSPADVAGLRQGDVVVGHAGLLVESAEAFGDLLARTYAPETGLLVLRAGDPVELVLARSR